MILDWIFKVLHGYFLLLKFNESDERANVLTKKAVVMLLPVKTHTDDGLEMTFWTNHLGHFLLTNLLLEKLKASKPARAVNVSALAHVKVSNFDFPIDAYCQSKLANILFFSRQLAWPWWSDRVFVASWSYKDWIHSPFEGEVGTVLVSFDIAKLAFYEKPCSGGWNHHILCRWWKYSWSFGTILRWLQGKINFETSPRWPIGL